MGTLAREAGPPYTTGREERTVSFVFVHAADLHLDTPFEGMARVSPAVGARLRDASLEAFDALVALAMERNAAFVLLAGDIYDGPERGVRAQLRFLRGLERLSAQGIDTFVVHGNHDPVGGWSAIRSWPRGVTVFGPERVETVAIEREGVRIATVYGQSFGEREVTENLVRGFRRTAAVGVHIGLLHCNAGGSVEHEPHAPCSLRDLRAAGFDYWALGHIHRRQYLSEGDPWIVYPGNLQGRSPKPSERGPKGACVVTVEGGGGEGGAVRRVEHVPLDRVRFRAIDIDVGGAVDLAELRRSVLERAEGLRRKNPERGLVLRVFFEGRGGVSRDLGRPGVLDALLRELREEAEGLHPFLWWERLIDRTRLLLDLAAISRRGDFSAELVNLTNTLVTDAEARASFLEGRWRELPHAHLREWLAEPSTEQALVELEEGRNEALDLLEEEDVG